MSGAVMVPTMRRRIDWVPVGMRLVPLAPERALVMVVKLETSKSLGGSVIVGVMVASEMGGGPPGLPTWRTGKASMSELSTLSFRA